MPLKRPELVNSEIYHIVLRGVDDSLIFKDINDYYRGIFSIYEFNNSKAVSIKERRKIRIHFKTATRGQSSGGSEKDKELNSRDKLARVLAFCFMPNHIHLILKQIKDGGITNYMRKVGTGYASYFNKKYSRKGHLFQGRFKAVHIKDDEQLKTAFVYVHTNPISLIEPGWKENGVENPDEVIKYLENYKWSSYQDYLEKKNFPSVTNRDFLLEVMGEEEGCREFVNGWIKYKKEIRYFGEIGIE